MMSFQEFIHMGGHGFYVWSSYLIVVVVFVGLFISVKMQRKSLLKQIRRHQRQLIEIKEKN